MKIETITPRVISQKRRRAHALRVYVDPSEAQTIEAHASQAGMSASNYLRALGIGYRPESMVDQTAIIALAKIAGDQGRLGGLLKLWLSTRPGEGASEYDVSGLLREIQDLQPSIREKVLSL